MKSFNKQEILEEFLTIFNGKTLDAIFPPLFFVLLNNLISLNYAIIGALSIATIIGLIRVLSKQKFFYAIAGWGGVAIASGFAFIADSATNFFLPSILTSSFLVIITIASLIIGKPLAAIASHLTRGWKLDWFWHDDVKPAYREVTWMWLLLFIFRAVLQTTLFLQESVQSLFWVNTLLGLPFTIAILIVSYVYGLWRLKQLKGPGIEEYLTNKQPPYNGQTRGF